MTTTTPVRRKLARLGKDAVDVRTALPRPLADLLATTAAEDCRTLTAQARYLIALGIDARRTGLFYRAAKKAG